MKGVVHILKSFFVWVFLLIGCIGGYFVYASTVDTTVYVPEELVIIPSSAESDSWLRLEHVLSQDLSRDSLLQEFSKTNSAYLLNAEQEVNESNGTEEVVPTTENNLRQELEVPVPTPVGESVESASQPESNVAEPNAAEVPETVPESSSQPDPQPISEPEAPSAPEPEPEPEPAREEASAPTAQGPVSIVRSVFSTIVQAFPFAQQVVDEPLQPDESPQEPATQTDPEQEVMPEDPPVEEVDSQTTDTETQTETGMPAEADGQIQSGSGENVPSEILPVEEVTVTETESTFSPVACEVTNGCERHSILFSGFDTPDFEGTPTLDSVQVRLSLAAKEKIGASSEPQRFVVEYTYGTSSDWQLASIIDIDDELSNSINGDYFLATLAVPQHYAALATLNVRLTYEGDTKGLEALYVEGLWLEVAAGSFFDDVAAAKEIDTITYDRELLPPSLHELEQSDLDPALSTLPTFTLSYDPQQNFFRRIWTSLFSENTYSVEHVELRDDTGAVIDIPFGIEYPDDTTWKLSMLKQPQGLKPGKYTVAISVKENEVVYTDTFEFYWGVLAINPKKSMYMPLEKVEVHMAALTDTGDTICDADLTLTITDPKHNIFEVPIERSGECGANNVTDVPDYKAEFQDTGEWGVYTMQLEHKNIEGVVVHKVRDTFEVREYVPFDIERSAPTRIYPPAPYTVDIKVKAYRDFIGDINERVPRGFEIVGLENAEVSTLPEYTLITWKDVTMKEGDELTLHYEFNAPDISPYMYLLGPLDMDGFAELRQWQIASDAVTSAAWLTGTRTVNGTNLNAAASAFQWSTSSVDSYYFEHSTTSDSHKITVRQNGDYFLAVTLPQHRTDGNSSRTRVGVEVRVNGTVVPEGLGRSAYIRNANSHSESSSHAHFLLNDLEDGDYVEVYAEGLTSIDAGDIVNVTGQAGLYLEYIEATQNVFAATTTRTASSTNLNQTTASALEWTETRQDTGFVHSDSINPDRITLSNAGTYIVHINVPLTGDTDQQNVLGRVRLDGVEVNGGIFAQGYQQDAGTESDGESSIHWSGVVVSTTTNQVLTVTTEREANSGTTTVTSGFAGSIYVEQLATADAIVLQGRSPGGATDWSDAGAETIAWDTQVAYSTSTYTHSTTVNADDIVIDTAGDYLLTYNDAMTSATQRSNNRITVQVDGVEVPGAQTKSHYMRNQSAHNNSSGALVWLLTGLTPGQTINILTEQEGNNATINDTTDATVTLTKKAAVNLRPDAPAMFNTPFDNIRFASTTPYFLFQTGDPDGSFDMQYQFSISTSSDFSASTTKTSGVDSGFANVASSTDTSPFLENNQIRYQLQSGNALTDLTTYYWRVRARDVNGSNLYGDWSTTQSLTVDMAAEAPNWFQSYSGQFEGDTLVGTVSSGDDQVQVDATVSSEVLAVYGEGTVTTPRYRLWDGDSWSVEGSAVGVTNTINWLTTAAGISRDEYVMVTLDQSNDAYAQVYSASSSSWGNQTLLSPVVTSNAYRGIAVAYESLSGDAMAISCTNSPDPVYRIWNGTSWSATSTINASSVNNCNFLAIASDPASDEIIVVVRDTSSQYEALVWNGSSWVDNRVIGSSAKVAREGMAVAYESSGNQALIVVSNGLNNSVAYTTWNGTEFGTNATQAIGNDFEFGKLTADPNSDNMALCYIDEDNDIGVLRWDGGVWSATSERTTTGNSDLARPVDCEFETTAGRSGNIMLTYGDTGTDGDYYDVYTSGAWIGAQTGSDINDAFWVQTERAGDGTIIALHLDDENDYIDATYWNGTNWDTRTNLEGSPSSVAAAPYEVFSMSAKRFQFTEGSVQTPPISFTSVPNQPTWGDVTFSTTEPFGTDVSLRVKYTSTTTCDSYVPDGVLAGNGIGFDVDGTPIDLTGLSTSTYDEICLVATITTQGSASASLDDWTLSWVREAKLIQQNYRWYVNEDSVTPTDPWPALSSDLAENAPVSSASAVDVGEAIRLRMSVRGSNVEQPASGDAFKLQYAEGFTCTPFLSWQDVGDTSSSTALWRGHNNASVSDGQSLSSTVLSESDAFETYEEQNPTASNANTIPVDNDSEWDFSLENNGASVDTEYCFRMVYADSSVFSEYTNYPRLITNAPPPAPELYAPFDNERLASSSPWFEFASTDDAGDLVSYEIEIDTDYDFGSVDIARNSNDHFTLFTNLRDPAERGQYTSGQTIQFIPDTTLTNNTTYWWRVRAKDDPGSNTLGAWSTPQSLTVTASTTITTWYQTMGEQFATDALFDLISSTSTHDIGIESGFTAGTTTTSLIDFDDRDVGNAWGALSWVDNETSGTIDYFVEYEVSEGTFSLIPDGDLPGNSAGFNSSPVSLIDLDTETYNEIRIMAVFSGNTTWPRLQDLTVTWGETIEVPTLEAPFDNEKVSTTSPTFRFTTTDPEDNDLQYELQLSSTYDFAASSTFLSGVQAGFSNTASSSDTSPYYSGDTIRYSAQSSLSNGSTYWWRVRARDPGGSNAWSDYSDPQSFTIDTSVTVSTWYQTTGEQFETDLLVDIETTGGAAQITSTLTEVLMAYAEGAGQAPRYRTWNGSEWSAAGTADSVGSQILWTELEAAPTRPEYALGTIGSDADVNVQIYNSQTDNWGNVQGLTDDLGDTARRGFDVAYETNSGDLLAVSCVGTEAMYAIWDGSSWSATSSISLANANNCLVVELANDPTSDEIIAIFRHTNTGASDYEVQVWDGSSWDDSIVFGNMSDNANYGHAVVYEESGNQAMVVVSDGNNPDFLYSTWNGSSWSSTTQTFTIEDDLEFASLRRDEGTDRIALCYIDADTNLGVVEWDGNAWGSYTEIEQTGNAAGGQPIDCAYETAGDRDGYLMVPYSDTVAGQYQYFATTTPSSEQALTTMNDSWRVSAVRSGDGFIHVAYFDDANNRVDVSHWDGADWTTRETITTNPSVTGTPFDGPFTMAAQVYPNFTAGSVRSTPIDYTTGSGPKWEEVTWDDTTPGASYIEYRVYYLASSSEYELIPDTELAGNSAGFTTGPIDLANVDQTVYETLQLDAQFVCVSGDCPTLNDWEVVWSEGISVSGIARLFDQSTVIASGTVAVAVNGVLQVGKTGTISSGFQTEQQVYTASGTETFSVPDGVTSLSIKAWGAGGGGGGGGDGNAGSAGGGGGYVAATATTTPGEDLTIRIGGGGGAGNGSTAGGGGGGGGYSGVLRGSAALAIAAGGGGGGGGDSLSGSAITYVNDGAECAVSGASCTPGIPTGTQADDVLVAVLYSRTDTTHTCTANCTGWTEFSSQAGTNGRLSVWYLRRGGSAPANPTFGGPATESYSGRIWAFRGVINSGNPYDVLSANSTQAAAATFTGTDLTSTVSNVMSVFVGGALDNNTWGPAGGPCTVPGGVDANFYTANGNGTDNSLFLCYDSTPTNVPGALGSPTMAQASLGNDAGRWFNFALRSLQSSGTAPGAGGAGGGTTGIVGGSAGTAGGGGGGTQSAGGAAGGGTAGVGGALVGGNGGSGSGGASGGFAGTNGGGAGGTGNASNGYPGGGGGGGGYYGGGGGEEADSQSVSAAGGGGGSSYASSSLTATSTQSGTSTTPGNNGDGDYGGGAGVGGSGGATSSAGTAGTNGRVVLSWTEPVESGAWSIPNVNLVEGDVVTVFIQGVGDTNEAVAVGRYDGTGNMTGLKLYERHLTIGSDDASTTPITNTDIGMYDRTDSEDAFQSVSSGVLTFCSDTGCNDGRLEVLSGTAYQPGGNGSVINFRNGGTFSPQSNTLRVSRDWEQNGTFTTGASTVMFTATSSSYTLTTASTTHEFYNVTFGEGSGSATWTTGKPLSALGTLAVDYGTLSRGTSTLSISGDLRIGANGLMSGRATTTFAGSGSNLWTDNTSSTMNIGYVVIDGAAKTVTLGGNVAAQTVTIGSNDTLNTSGSGFNMNVYGSWTNNNSFVPQTGTVSFVGTSTGVIARGASSFNNLSFSGAGGAWSFSTSTLAITGNFTIATGTVTLPTATTTIGGSFLNTGGTFAHNNATVLMSTNSAGRSITQNGNGFLNTFYNLSFSGSGSWTFTESNATTSNDMRIGGGTVTFPSTRLTLGGDLYLTGTGAFTHNSGEVLFLVQSPEDVRVNSSSFNHVRVGAASGTSTRTFADTNLTILGNLTLDTSSSAVFPSGILSVGGSFDNNGSFSANSGTVRFNSTAGVETVAAGNSSFATVEFNSATGDFTITEHATATVALNLTSASQFTLSNGISFESRGTFTNAANGSNTTWSGSTLRLTSGNDFALNTKTATGDFYGTLVTDGDTDVTMWNSSSSAYTTASTSSIYSQDHGAVDGDLYIFGNYVRTTGTEYWNYTTDFDGTALGGGSRQVDVRVAGGATVGFTGASLNITGSTSASTTIDAQSGSFSVSATNTTLSARYFSVAGTDTNGLRLVSSSTITTLDDGLFSVVPGRTGITIDGSTVDTNPLAQFNRIRFATTTPGAASNVTLTGTATSSVWFRTGSGDLYGEAYDAGDADPGAIRFDDSSYNITVSGTIYSDDGVTTMGAPTCDGSTPNVRIVIDGGTFSTTTSCSGANGSYTFPTVAYVGDPSVVVYLNTNGGEVGSVISKTPTANISNMHVYANRIITRHENTAPLTIADMSDYDSTDDTDLRFTAGTSTLTLLPNTELFVFASTTFAPGGNLTLLGNGNSTSYEGTLQLGATSTFTAAGTETHTLAGRFVARPGATFTSASSTFVFNATTSGKSITSSSTLTFNELQFNGAGGGWHITAPLTVAGSMAVTAGTVTGTSDIRVVSGSLSGNGMLSLGSGTTTIERSNTLGGSSAWTFNNLRLGNGTVVGTTTPGGSATTTILGRLTIATAHFLDGNTSVWNLNGAGTVFTETGTFLEDTTVVRYSGANANVLATTYYDLKLDAAAGSSTFTGTGSGINVLRDLTVGGTASTAANFVSNDPVLAVGNDLFINSNGTFVGSDSAAATIAGSYDNNGTFVGSGGTLTFTGSGSETIAAGNSSFSSVTMNGTGAFTVSENATATNAFTLTNHSNFTVGTGTVLSVGGQFTNGLGGGATEWSGSTLHLYGTGGITVNTSATSDTYGTLAVASGRRVRMWNSSANTYNATGGIYSMDHGGSNGLLHIYGTFIENTATDHWSYATDFDGTSLTGSERTATVRMANGATVSYTGGSLAVVGGASASTTIENQGSGTFAFTLAGTASTSFNHVVIRDTNASGTVFSATPTVNEFTNIDHLVEINNGTAITVGGGVIDANQAKNFTGNMFEFGGGVTGAVNVTATGTTVSSWRFTNHSGNLDGESFDSDPGGDPGYIVWDDSAALVTIAGTVYSDEGSTVSTVCDSSTQNIVLRVAGLTSYSTSCNGNGLGGGTGAFSIPNVAFSPNDTLTLYIDGETEKAANITVDPVSSIGNMHLYENRIILRHESTDPISILDLSVWDSSDDADIPFTAVDGTPDTLTVPANRKLLIWTGKTFAPGGNVTLAGGGAGAAYDGTLEAQANSVFRASGAETHSIGGSFIFGNSAVFTPGLSTTTFTTSGAARTIDVNDGSFYNAAFTGSGSWSITDATARFANSFAQTGGALTFPTGTTTVGRSFNATGGSFTINGSPLYFTATSGTSVVTFDDSEVAALRFQGGGGSWTMTDTNATATQSFTVASGTVSLPSGNFAVGGNFRNIGGTITHNTSDLILTATSTGLLRASSSDLYSVRLAGGAAFTFEDVSMTLLDSLTVATGSATFGTGTLSVGGSFNATGGTFAHSSGTVLLNSSSGSRTVSPGSSTFYNLQVSAPAGTYTLSSATTTNNFTLASVSSLTLTSGQTLAVGGVFTNSVGGGATTFTGSTVRLYSGTGYSANSRTSNGDTYGTLIIGANTDVRMWNSSAATSTIESSGSLYSQDHGNVNGNLNIYGDLHFSTTTEYWSYATDFDGTSLTGSERAVNVYMAPNATTTLAGGTLQILGHSASTTDIENMTTGTYAFLISGGTINASHYTFDDLDGNGLSFSGTPTVTELSNGHFDLGVNGGSLITLSSTTLNANPSKNFSTVGFATSSAVTGYNVNLVGATGNAWRFSTSYGNLSGEDFDNDGVDECGSIRFDDSSCLLTAQTHVRWRNDDGGEGAPDSEWYNAAWEFRKRVRFVNGTADAVATTALKMTVTYDSDMQSDFEDLRFTDDDGTTLLSHWVERYTPSTNATVWVEVPSLPAEGTATVFMYYGSSTAATVSSGANTFLTFDDFEDNNISEYSGDTSLFQTDTNPVYGGSYALEAANQSGRTTDGIYRTDVSVSQGEVIRWMQYVSTAAPSDEGCTMFGVQSPGSTGQNYAVCLELFGVDRISLSRDVDDNDVSGTVLATTTVSYTTGWYEVEVDWQTDDSIDVYLYNAAGALVATTSATDGSYTAGGIGYTFWIQKGAWDSYTSRVRGGGRPTVYFGAEQQDGGATWASALDSAGSNFETNDIARLRIAIENSGLDIDDQEFQLEYVEKGAAPSCESIDGSSYTAVPNTASCGSSPVCMGTSASLTGGDPTTDLLFETNGTFMAGQILENPSTKTSAFDVDQNFYTELEFVLTPTVNADDAICFRVTNNGTELDFYDNIAEMGLQFDPSMSAMTLNSGNPITLTPGTTTLVYATGTVTDFNGYADLVSATTTFYRSGVGAACSVDQNSCYRSYTATSTCSFTACSGSSCTLSCVASVYYHADPTDAEAYEGEEWLAFVEVEDASGGYDFSTTPGVELSTLRALSVGSSINYGSLSTDTDTGAVNATTTVSNLGNDGLDVNIEATDLTSGVSYIPASEQKFGTTTFTYNTCTTCGSLSSSTLTSVPLDLPKPTAPTPYISDDLYWGIYVPFGALPTAHQGINIFYAIGD